MLTTILTYFLVWFNTGVAAQILMCIFDGLINRRWPIGFNDARHFVLAGLFGFISLFNALMFMIRFAIDPEQFVSHDEDEEGEEDCMYIVGLTREEQKKVEAYVSTLLESRVQEKNDGE